MTLVLVTSTISLANLHFCVYDAPSLRLREAAILALSCYDPLQGLGHEVGVNVDVRLGLVETLGDKRTQPVEEEAEMGGRGSGKYK